MITYTKALYKLTHHKTYDGYSSKISKHILMFHNNGDVCYRYKGNLFLTVSRSGVLTVHQVWSFRCEVVKLLSRITGFRFYMEYSWIAIANSDGMSNRMTLNEWYFDQLGNRLSGPRVLPPIADIPGTSEGEVKWKAIVQGNDEELTPKQARELETAQAATREAVSQGYTSRWQVIRESFLMNASAARS